MSMKSIARSGAEGNTRLQKMYGAGSTPPRQDYPKGYATGGAVKAYAGGGMVAPDADGMAAKPNLGRPGRKMAKGKSGKSGKGTNVNVVIMPKPDAPKAPADMTAPPPAMVGPAPMPPPAAGPGGPPPPMPMRAKGGRVKREDGGKVDDLTDDQRKAIKKDAIKESMSPADIISPTNLGAKIGAGVGLATAAKIASAIPKGMKAAEKYGKGGLDYLGKALPWVGAGAAVPTMVGHGMDKVSGNTTLDREREEIKRNRPVDGQEDRKTGGRVLKMQAGAASGPGRIEKVRKQKRA